MVMLTFSAEHSESCLDVSYPQDIFENICLSVSLYLQIWVFVTYSVQSCREVVKFVRKTKSYLQVNCPLEVCGLIAHTHSNSWCASSRLTRLTNRI